MRKNWMLGIVGALAFALLSSTAFAGTVIDKGSLGTYERHGRFVKRDMAPSAGESVAQAVPAREAKVVIDKGTFGTYERQGRFVHRVVNIESRHVSRGNVVAESGGVRHEHGIGSREHKNISN